MRSALMTGLTAVAMYVACTVGIFWGRYRQAKEDEKRIEYFRENLGYKIVNVSLKDMNSDGLSDIVLEQNSRDKIVFYNTGNGYLTAEQMNQREIEKINQSYKEQLRKTNEFYKKAYDRNDLRGEK